MLLCQYLLWVLSLQSDILRGQLFDLSIFVVHEEKFVLERLVLLQLTVHSVDQVEQFGPSLVLLSLLRLKFLNLLGLLSNSRVLFLVCLTLFLVVHLHVFQRLVDKFLCTLYFQLQVLVCTLQFLNHLTIGYQINLLSGVDQCSRFEPWNLWLNHRFINLLIPFV